jgi:uncharacterized LabA/DUF88 family protein
MRVAVFVDAGYVYAQGSALITRSETKKPRKFVNIDGRPIVEKLTKLAISISGKKELLRIYWYDGAPATGRSPEQIELAQLDNVKLRLGQLNSAGQQKGVDSLIVTDLMELARNNAISDAVVVTGDEDIRIGVQIAQSHGVRVHLLGIGAATNKGSQSLTLQDEADTVTEWGKSDVEAFMRYLGEPTQPVTKAKIEKIQPTAKPISKPKEVATKPTSTAPAKVIQNATKIDGAQILKAAQKTFDDLKLDLEKFSRAIKTVTQGKDVPGPIVAKLKDELFKFNNKNPTKSENKIAREELSKMLREAS